MHDRSDPAGGGQPAQAAVGTSERPKVDNDFGPSDVPADGRSTGTFLRDIGAAMIQTAERERDRITGDLTAQLDAHLDALRDLTSQDAQELIRRTEAEVDGIRGWSATEHARVRDESEGRVAALREELERRLSQQDVGLAREIAAMSDSIQAYQTELDVFVRRLGEERDPRRIARRAAQMPEPPRLQDIAAAAHERKVTNTGDLRDPAGMSTTTAGNGHRPGDSNRDLIGVMAPDIPRRMSASTGEMVGAVRAEPDSNPPHAVHPFAPMSQASQGTVEPAIGPPGHSLDDERRPKSVGSPDWTDVALRFLPAIVLVAIVAAVAYLLITGEATALAR